MSVLGAFWERLWASSSNPAEEDALPTGWQHGPIPYRRTNSSARWAPSIFSLYSGRSLVNQRNGRRSSSSGFHRSVRFMAPARRSSIKSQNSTESEPNRTNSSMEFQVEAIRPFPNPNQFWWHVTAKPIQSTELTLVKSMLINGCLYWFLYWFLYCV